MQPRSSRGCAIAAIPLQTTHEQDPTGESPISQNCAALPDHCASYEYQLRDQVNQKQAVMNPSSQTNINLDRISHLQQQQALFEQAKPR